MLHIVILTTALTLTYIQNSSCVEQEDNKEFSALRQTLIKQQALGLKLFCDSSYTSKTKSIKQELLDRSSQSPVLPKLFSPPTQLEAFIRGVADTERPHIAPAIDDDEDGMPALPNLLDYTDKLRANMNTFMKSYATKEQLEYYKKIGFNLKACLTFLKADYEEQIGYFCMDAGPMDIGGDDTHNKRMAREFSNGIFDQLIKQVEF